MNAFQFFGVAALGLGLSTSASAQMSVSDMTGGPIPATNSGGTGASWDTAQPTDYASSTVSVPVAVTNVNSITIEGLTHTWIGDLQVTLRDPNGMEHNVFVRPGYLNSSTFGDSSNFNGGDYTFVQCGAAHDLPTMSGGGQDPVAGDYNQTFDTGGVTFTDGNNNIFNTPMCSISGPSGDWTLLIYDWAGGDMGSYTGWSLEFNGPVCGVGCGNAMFSDHCNGDGGDQAGCTNCPCGNNAAMGTIGGCMNSAGTSGEIHASGSDSVALADLRFEGSGMTPNSFSVLTSGSGLAPQNPANPCFGSGSGVLATVLDGLRCAVGNTQRHGGRPVAGDGTVGLTTNGWGPPNGRAGGLAAQGGFAPGETRYFQVFYRELPGTGCLTQQNTTQAVRVTFAP